MLPANALWKDNEKRMHQRQSAVVPILNQLFHRIKQHAISNPGAPYIVSAIPTFVFGYPLYTYSEVVQTVHITLEKQGYQVWEVSPGTLLISWVKPETTTRTPQIQRPSVNYRPNVYNDESLEILRQKIGR